MLHVNFRLMPTLIRDACAVFGRLPPVVRGRISCRHCNFQLGERSIDPIPGAVFVDTKLWPSDTEEVEVSKFLSDIWRMTFEFPIAPDFKFSSQLHQTASGSNCTMFPPLYNGSLVACETGECDGDVFPPPFLVVTMNVKGPS
jgi:hypothetical protein